MLLTLTGLNHRSCPVELRERAAVADEALAATLANLGQRPGVREALIISTCNRTEIYAELDPGAERAVPTFLQQHGNFSSREAASVIYEKTGDAAVRHLFEVATGLDSMVLGEPQILGQVKDAWRAARQAGTIGANLDRLFQDAFAVAKAARSGTSIGRHPVSVATTAIRLIESMFAPVREISTLLIGAGDTIELAARQLQDRGARDLLFANRTLEHAQALAARHHGLACTLDELPHQLSRADVVITATASPEPIVLRADVVAALAKRPKRPMFLVDLGVPRDIAPDVGELADAFLYDLDDLARVVDEHRGQREAAAIEARAIIALAVERHSGWRTARGRLRSLDQLRARADAMAAVPLARAQAELAAGQDPAKVIARLARATTARLVHPARRRLRDAALAGDESLLAAAERLFDLRFDDNEPEA